MKQIYQDAVGDRVQGCEWEINNKFLVDPKKDVGNFYNDPELVYEKNRIRNWITL